MHYVYIGREFTNGDEDSRVLCPARAGGELHRLPVRRMTVGIGPVFFAGEQGGRIGQAFGCDESLKGGQPVVVVVGTVVGLAAIGCRLEFGGERGGPFFPGEMALLGELDRKGERLSLPRLGKRCQPDSAAKRGQPAEIPVGKRGRGGKTASRFMAFIVVPWSGSASRLDRIEPRYPL